MRYPNLDEYDGYIDEFETYEFDESVLIENYYRLEFEQLNLSEKHLSDIDE